jgi:hypothetical protein
MGLSLAIAYTELDIQCMRSNWMRVYFGFIYEMGCGRTLRYRLGL